MPGRWVRRSRADDNRFASGDPDELQLKAPTPDLFFQEEDFLAARGSHWGPPGLGWEPGCSSDKLCDLGWIT